jgi:uncharacterized repeat protein (TIGR01451 family)
MKRTYWLALILALAGLVVVAPLALATAYHPITVDGDLSDWAGDEYLETDGGYDLYLTWDATNLYLGLSGAYLGDTGGQDSSFFACFDTNLTAGSGAAADGYGNVAFNTNLFAPEFCYYFAGGGGWFEWSSWNGAAWDWQGWDNTGTYYNWPGNPAPLPGSELTIPRSNLGNPTQVGVVAWLTAESPSGPASPVLASWPTPNPDGVTPTLYRFYKFSPLGDGISPNSAVPDATSSVQISEIRTDQPSTDNDEYFELAGTAGTSLNDLTYLVIGDGTGGSGVIEEVTALTGQTMPGSGFFVAAESTFSLGTADLVTDLNFENSDNVTHLIVRDFSGALNEDLDTNDDGILDVTPWTEVVDLIALILEDNPPVTTEYHYGPPTVGPDGSYVPGHAYRCSSTWIVGQFDPAAGDDTPGTANLCSADVAVDKVGPATVAASSTMTYTLSYENGSPFDAQGVVITDILPNDVSYRADGSGLPCPACTPGATGTLTWYVGTLTSTNSVFFTLTVTVSDSVPFDTVLTNTAEITAAGDAITANNSATVETTVVGVDLSVSKTGPTGPVWPGDTITYTISFDLLGTDPALDIALTDTFPADFTYTGHHVYPSMNCTPTVASLVCATPTLTQAGWLVITGTVASSPSSYVLTNTAEIAASNDGSTGNNSDEYVNYLVMPIQEIQYVPDPANDDASPYADQYVWVEGVATAGSDVFLSGTGGQIRYFIEDPAGGPWSGLYVYKGSSLPAVQEGDWVLLYGYLSEYYGVTELDLTAAGGIQQIISSGNPLPPPEVLATAAYTPTGAATAEAYESVLIEFQSAVVTSVDPANGEWTFDDGSGETRADDWSSLLTYEPAIGDLYGFIRGIGNFYNEYKLVPRYDADVDLDYAVTFVYHDLEQVVPDGVTLHIAGNFNGWSTTATPMDGDGTDDVYTATVVLDDVPYDLEYKYIAGDSWDNGQGDILNTSNHQTTVTESTVLDEYRSISSGWAKLNGPSPITINLGDPTPVITGETWFSDLPFGANQVLVAELGYGTDADLNTWTWSEATFSGRVGNNDAFSGTLTPAATGVFSFAIRFDGNWGTGNPNSTWYAGDLDGNPFDIGQAGVLTVVAPELTIDKTVAPKEDIGLGSVVTFTIVLSNSGDADALSVIMTDVLPLEVDFGGWIEQNGAIEANDALTWTGSLSGGMQLTFAFTATVGTDDSFYGQPVTNIAYFDSDNAGSGSDGTGFTILPAPEKHHIYLPIVVKND